MRWITLSAALSVFECKSFIVSGHVFYLFLQLSFIIIFPLIYVDFFSSVSVFQFFSLYVVSRAFVMFH